jgi:hypothetical protein
MQLAPHHTEAYFEARLQMMLTREDEPASIMLKEAKH